jgi:hypothetical protein
MTHSEIIGACDLKDIIVTSKTSIKESKGAGVRGIAEYVKRRTGHQNVHFIPFDYSKVTEAKIQINNVLPDIVQ